MIDFNQGLALFQNFQNSGTNLNNINAAIATAQANYDTAFAAAQVDLNNLTLNPPQGATSTQLDSDVSVVDQNLAILNQNRAAQPAALTQYQADNTALQQYLAANANG